LLMVESFVQVKLCHALAKQCDFEWIGKHAASPFEFKFEEFTQKAIIICSCVPYFRNYWPSEAVLQSVSAEVSSSKLRACWREPRLSHECLCIWDWNTPKGNNTLTLGLTVRARIPFPWGNTSRKVSVSLTLGTAMRIQSRSPHQPLA
jgi:hypothetical protein